MADPFPHRYEVELKRTQAAQAEISAGPRPSLAGGPPPQFGGRDAWWSPEHLLLASASLCLMDTFIAVAEKSKLAVEDYRSRAEGTLDKTPEGLVFTDITLHVSVKVAEDDRERAERLLDTAKKYCIVSNSLKKPVNLKIAVSAS